MPNHGDQHKANNALTSNPFEEQKRPISGYTAQEIATLQSRLNKRLGPEFVSTRPGPGNQKIPYLSAEKAISLANEVFGFNGWSSSIQQIDVDFVDENPNTGKVSLGLSVIVRVTLKDGTFHEDIGYGVSENAKGKAMAFEKSKKEATTDALKRALRNFGNVLGNCMYDRNFLAQVSKVKPGAGKAFDINDLHRHPDFAPKTETHAALQQIAAAPLMKTEAQAHVPTAEFEDSFDMGEFDDVDFDDGDLGRPDEILLPVDSVGYRQRPPLSAAGSVTTPSKHNQHNHAAANRRGPAQPISGKNAGMQANGLNSLESHHDHSNDQDTTLSSDEIAVSKRVHTGDGDEDARQQIAPAQPTLQPTVDTSALLGFYSAKATQRNDSNKTGNIPPLPAFFNPHAESPSIRKTAGVDHSRSIPIKRDSLRPEGTGPQKDFVEPKIDMSRRIGMPGSSIQSAHRTGSNASAYRPPTRHGSPAGNMTMNERPSPVAKRPPLIDISNGNHNVTAVTGDGADAKRQRTTGTLSAAEVRPAGGTENSTF